MVVKPIRVIGIDPSLTATGICVTDETKKVILSEEINTRAGDQARIPLILGKLSEIYKKYDVSFVAIEGFAFSAQGRSVFDLGELSGCIKYMLKVPMVVIPPTVVKKFATGKGNCHKDLILLEVFKRFGENFDTSNKADAYVLAVIGFCYFNGYEGWNLNHNQLEVLTKFKKNYENSSLF